MTTKVEQSVEVAVPVTTAYNQWTQLQEFPEFMEGVERVDQITDTRSHWVTSVAGVKREFDAEVTEQIPDERMAWTSIDGPKQAGVVTFHRLSDTTCKVMLQLDHDPQGIAESVGDKLGFLNRRATGDLERFKKVVEERGHETGAWRGRV
ncbi:SRPBCC family protein [Streptomyces meridianus]|uniref:SRPBCC family protein n=1 Tax=Streptomyces meridianus TaxID=2938945 RepID=A0ABT0X431_9ACTN|nr:SRPBCC family protein [Streptomyces meridianus]MCM2577080.1 SRPBCC family protein [Streptomyces meridianus]